jgi:hypothetical protein
VEQDSPVTLWTLRRGTSTRECRAVFVGNRIEGQLLVNGRIIHIWVFSDGESLRGWAEQWRREYQAESWHDMSVSDAAGAVQ